MKRNLRYILPVPYLFFLTLAHAQVEVAHLSTRGFSTTGIGLFFNWGNAVSKGDAITYESGATLFQHRAVITPVVFLGYRHTFNGKGTGLYFEPQFAYTFGSSNIPKRDSVLFPQLKDGKGYINQPDLSGLSPVIGLGYLFPGKFAFNLGLKYQHVFVAGGPAVNIYSLRVAHAIVFDRKKYS